ncbi:MAG: alpha-hydroxy acid oxidase, partial [Woeseiaceae bacterium]
MEKNKNRGASVLASRRAFLQFLAASPAVYVAGQALGQDLVDPYAPQVIARASDAINVFDFHEVAKQTLLPGHYTYMSLGSDDGGTLRANREGFKQVQLRIRRLVDVRNIDTSVELFGERYPVPVMLAPCGSHKAFHPDAELAVARAARSRGVEQMLSTVASTALEDVNAARGRPVWFQLYPDESWEATEALVKRAERAGCPVLVLTIDNIIRNRDA